MSPEMQKYIDYQLTEALATRLDAAFKKALSRTPELQDVLQSDVFYPNIPDADHNPSDDQPLMQLNNQKIVKQWATNHVGISDTSNYGKHTRIDLQNFTEEQEAAGGFALLYVLDNVLTYKTADNKKFPIPAEGSIGTSGWIRIGAGENALTMQWGSNSGGNNKQVDFPVAFKAPPNVQLTILRTTGVRNVWVMTNSATTTKFNLGTDAGDVAFYWLAMGL